MKQIKEKPEGVRGLKEHIRAAPKEVVRRSVRNGTERMKEQRQQEQPEDYANEKVTSAVEGIPSAAVASMARIQNIRRTAKKKAEAAEVKTKESYVMQQEPTTAAQPPQALEQGKQAYVEKQHRQTIVRQVESRYQNKESGSIPVETVREQPSRSNPAMKTAQYETEKTKYPGVFRERSIGRGPKQGVKTAETAEASGKAAQAVQQGKQLAIRTVRSTQRVLKESAAAVRRSVSTSLSGLMAAGGGISVMVILVVILFGGVLLLFGDGLDSTAYTPVSEEVHAYEPLIRLYAEKYGIPEYVELIEAIMMTESGGKGRDPMQASESGYNTRYPRKPKAIQDPEYSIDVGVQTVAAVLKEAKVEGPSDLEHIKLALQGYNFGNGYIAWALEKYGGYSEANAIEFSEMMAKRLGMARYGSTKYVSVVLQYYPYGHVLSGAGNGDFIWPLPGYTRISSPFGYRICPYHGRELHGGVDLPAPLGTNILAAKSGTVVLSTYGASYGNHVAISHADGTRTMYCHMSARLVKVGDKVSQGQVIGRVGSTGDSTGNHLHFEIWTNSSSSSRVNPMDYFK